MEKDVEDKLNKIEEKVDLIVSMLSDEEDLDEEDIDEETEDDLEDDEDFEDEVKEKDIEKEGSLDL